MQQIWQRSMKNSANKIVASLLMATFSNFVNAGNLILFDSSNLVAYQSNAGISGFYREDDDRRSCYFFFYQLNFRPGAESANNYSIKKIDTFGLDYGKNKFLYRDRFGGSDIPGYIYEKYNGWVISTKDEPGGCGFEVGSFHFPPTLPEATHYSVTKTIPAEGIRVVGGKSYFYDQIGTAFVKRNGYLIPGDAVVVLQGKGVFSFVRFSDPTNGKVTTGWIRSSDLVNPFPPSFDQPSKNQDKHD
jgi:hypothetical protein